MILFCNDTATTEIYTLSLHDALPISIGWKENAIKYDLIVDADYEVPNLPKIMVKREDSLTLDYEYVCRRSEEHTSELQSLRHLVCRLLLEKKKRKDYSTENTMSVT